MKKLILIICLVSAFITYATSPARGDKLYEVIVAPADGRWDISLGEPGAFSITVLKNGVPASGEVICELSNDHSDTTACDTLTLVNGQATASFAAWTEPGFERCAVKYVSPDGRYIYSGAATIGIAPEEIRKFTPIPDDFDTFWARAIEQINKQPLKYKLTPLPDRSTDKVEAYHVCFNGVGAAKFYGMLAIPKGEGKFPAIVQYPGAGVYAIDPNIKLAERGVICLSFNIHGIEPNLPAQVYTDLGNGALSSYPTINIENRDTYYYKKVIQGAVRAIDCVLALPQCDGQVATYGGSQGGFLAIAVGALHPKVKYVVANYPALSDMEAYLYGHKGGWPHYLKNVKSDTDPAVNTLRYYDTANFAARLDKPIHMSFGYNDLTCVPRTCYAVYNAIHSPKSLYIAPLTGHFTIGEQREDIDNTVLSALGVIK